MDRATSYTGDGVLKEEKEEGDEVVVSADGWVVGLFCHI